MGKKTVFHNRTRTFSTRFSTAFQGRIQFSNQKRKPHKLTYANQILFIQVNKAKGSSGYDLNAPCIQYEKWLKARYKQLAAEGARILKVIVPMTTISQPRVFIAVFFAKVSDRFAI